MRKALNIFMMTFILTFGHAQTKDQNTQTCQLTYDKDLGVEIYQRVEVQASVDEHKMDSTMLSDSFKFRAISKKYRSNQMVQLVYLIDKDGTPKLIKVLQPKKDPEIESEARRIISLLPIHTPAKCGQEAVPSIGNLNIRQYPKDKSTR
jgi:hypothetical protein